MDALTLANEIKAELRKRCPHAIWQVAPEDVPGPRGTTNTMIRVDVQLEVGEVTYSAMARLGQRSAQNNSIRFDLPGFMLGKITAQLIDGN